MCFRPISSFPSSFPAPAISGISNEVKRGVRFWDRLMLQLITANHLSKACECGI